MNNSIDSRLDSGVQRLTEHAKTAPGKAGDGVPKSSQQDRKAAGVTPADQLQLTERARSLKAIEEQVRQAPDVDHQRVAELKQALKDGTYEINPSRIAEKLMALDALLPK